jgi:arylsulfatase A-like enzyme
MNRKRANPFCLYLSHKAVHHRFLPPPEMQNLYNQADLHLPPEADSWVSWAKGQVWTGVLGPLEREYRNYLATLTALDRQIGRIIDWVDNSVQAQNTVIVYASDNGYFWGEHRFVDKRWAYEEAIRVPFIVCYPDLVNRPGQPADQMILNVDLAPTLLEMAGLPIPSAMEGTSLIPLLRDRGASGRRAWMYEYFKDFPYNTPEHQAVRTRRHKFIQFQGGRPEELYDLARDPREMTNLIGTAEGVQLRPELAAMLEKLRRGVRL